MKLEGTRDFGKPAREFLVACFSLLKQESGLQKNMCDGIREPVSGSLLYGNNISAPRSYYFGPNRECIISSMHSAMYLGRLAIVTLSKASSELSMYMNPISLNSYTFKGIGEPILSWSKLDCLQTLIHLMSPQIKVDISFYRQDLCSCSLILCMVILKMCLTIGYTKGLFPLRIKRSNGGPKTNTPTFIGRIRKNNRTVGSSKLDVGESPKENRDDGVSVVPLIKGRETGKTIESNLDPLSIEISARDTEVNTIIKRWKDNDRFSKGIKIPDRFNKLKLACKKNTKLRVGDIYSLVYNESMLDLAYQKLKSNPGNMTPAIDSETLDAWGQASKDKLTKELKMETFQFTLSRMVNIPKPQGGTRGLKVASPRDKIVQQVLTIILGAIYEPSFSPNSFGFREGLGCHDALKHIHTKFQATRWFIEGDVSKCFDEIDHDLLINVLRIRIKDERFINLIRKALRSGYLDINKIPKTCIVGTPQGSVVSPMLCNIFMDQFDKYIDSIKPMFNRGKSRKQPPEYKLNMAQSNYFYKRWRSTGSSIYFQRAKACRKSAQSLPSTVVDDIDFRRLYYVRYADDWLIGFAGPYCEAVQIKNLCREFLASIKLRLNEDKTKITHAYKGILFLGSKIHLPLNQLRFKKMGGAKKRANLGVRLNAPIKKIIEKLHLNYFCDINGISKPKFALYANDKPEIIKTYISVYRGILNYYSFADNYKRLAQTLFSILRNSAAKLLAAKLKLKTVRQVLIKFGKYLGKGDDIHFTDPKNMLKRSLFKTKSPSSKVDALTQLASRSFNSGQRICAKCGSTLNVEMHHVKHMADLKNKSSLIEIAMIKRNRKQIPVCRICHMQVHVQIRKICAGVKTLSLWFLSLPSTPSFYPLAFGFWLLVYLNFVKVN